MITLETTKLYYNVRIHYRNEMEDDIRFKVDARLLFHRWLKEQGCRTLIPSKYNSEQLLVDTLGIALGYTVFEFEREEDATVFVLRHS